ncbi:MAG: helix-turn-helix domain-containing protein [Candidatus Hodarchaeales archaeon]
MEEKKDLTEELLQGKTLQIYWYLLTHGESGIREIQRSLNIPSPSTVSYHLKKLVSAGMVLKSLKTERYFVEEPVKTGILGLYIKMGKLMIPRILFYLSFFAFGSILYLFLIITRNNFDIHTEDFLFFFFSISGVIIFGYEAYRIWIMKPI